MTTTSWGQTAGGAEQIQGRGRIRVYWTATDVSVPSTLHVAEQGEDISAGLAEVEIPVGSGGTGFVDVEVFASQLNLSWQPGVEGDGQLQLRVVAAAR